MYLTTALLILLTIPSITPLTSLSSNNCPTTFDSASVNTTTPTLSAAVDFLYKNIYSPSEQTKIQAAFSSGNSSTVTAQVMTLSILIPFMLIAFAFLVMYIIAVCCCIF